MITFLKIRRGFLRVSLLARLGVARCLRALRRQILARDGVPDAAAERGAAAGTILKALAAVVGGKPSSDHYDNVEVSGESGEATYEKLSRRGESFS